MDQSKLLTSDGVVDTCTCAVQVGESGVVACLTNERCKWEIHFRYPIGHANRFCINPFIKQTAESPDVSHKPGATDSRSKGFPQPKLRNLFIHTPEVLYYHS